MTDIMVCYYSERGGGGGSVSLKMYKLTGGRSNKTVTWIKYVVHIQYINFNYRFNSQNKGGGREVSIYKYQPKKA